MKLEWSGRVISVQPRISLVRSFDQRHHAYHGYLIGVHGLVDAVPEEFVVRIGVAAYGKHPCRVGDLVAGQSERAPRREVAIEDLYKTVKYRVLRKEDCDVESSPPWHGHLPHLETFRKRGHRRLDEATYREKCSTCMWGCKMPVELIIDQWDPSKKKYRTETFCYGPKSCPFYKPGPKRRVPGRRGMSWVEEDWVDEEAVAHRGSNE